MEKSVINDNYAIYNSDSVDVLGAIPNESIGYSIFSPPFPELYNYTDLSEDLGNCKNYDEFLIHFRFIIKELYRIIKPGRSVSIHCMDIPIKKQTHGYIGLIDFPGDIIREFQKENFIYHSRVTIWKDPLIQAVRTHALTLAHKQIVKDSSVCANGLADYLITMRKPGDNKDFISHPNGFTEFIGNTESEPKVDGIKYSHYVWQKYASPVWMDINQSNTLQKKSAKDFNDEKHICPLQLDVIERGIELWSKTGDTVLSPFMGIGSEGHIALLKNRKFIGIELKKSYYILAEKNLNDSLNEAKSKSLFK